MGIATDINRTIISASEHAAPSYFCLGAMKGGTTLFFNSIGQMPQIKLPSKKEIHFFDRTERYYQGLNFYLNHFPLKGEMGTGDITGEATPFYLYHHKVPGRIKRIFPKAKFIVLLRNPSDRAYSHFHHSKSCNVIHDLTFERALQQEDLRLRNDLSNSYDQRYFSFKARGRYAEQLKRWFRYYGRDQFLILQSEEFFKNYENVLKETCDFLRVKFKLGINLAKEYDNILDPVNPGTRQYLVEYFEPYNQELYELLGVNYGWK